MLRKLLKNKLILFLFLILVLCLALIRAFETKLFYDPFISFFKDEFQNKTLPEFDSLKLYLNLIFRYFLNSFISILILYILFENKQLIKLSVLLYTGLFIVLLFLFFVIINYSNNYLLLFYCRRFIIQPIFLILFIPAFYYQKLNK